MNLKKFVNFINFNLIWTASIFLGNSAFALVVLLLVLHLLMMPGPMNEIKIVMATALIGYSVDCLLTLFGFFSFEQVQGITPLWLVLLWLGFSSTIGHSLSFLIGKPLLSGLLGGLAGGVTYLSAAHFNAVKLVQTPIVSFVVLALIWAFLLPGLIFLDNYLRKKWC